MATLTPQYVYDFICYEKNVYFMLFLLKIVSDPKTDRMTQKLINLSNVQFNFANNA